MKDLLKSFPDVMNFAIFGLVLVPLQTFQKSAIFIALLVSKRVKNIEKKDKKKEG